MEVVGGYKYPPTTSFISIQAFQTSHSMNPLLVSKINSIPLET
jgi:hypothetical protein